jgi:hypothetical protein
VVVSAPGLFTFQNFQLLGNGQCGLTAPGSTSVTLTGGAAMNNGSHNISCAGNVSATGFQSENAGGWGISAGSVTLSGCVVINNTNGGVSLGANTTSTANNCTFNGNRGIGMAANNGDTLVLSACDLMNNAGDGINANNWEWNVNMTLTGCDIADNGGDGINAGNSSVRWDNVNMNLTDCNLDGNAGDGITADGQCQSGTVTLAGCTLDDNGGSGINANNGWGSCATVGGVVTSCQAVGNGQGGILLAGSATLGNCEVRLNGGAGISVGGSGTITSATVIENVGPGISVGGSGTITEATVIQNTGTGIALGSGTISGSTASQNVGTGISVGSATVQNCVVTSNLTGVAANNLSLVGCLVAGNQGDGIQIGTGNGSVPTFGQGITGNVITNNGVGLQSYWNNGGASFAFTNNDIYGSTGQYDAVNDGTGTIVANNDYWGPITTAQLMAGATNLSRIYDYRDNSAVGQILVQTYSTNSVLGGPVITLQPVSVTVMPGQTTNFTVSAVGQPPLGYQWLFNGLDLTNGLTVSGSQTAQLTISNVTALNAGPYQVVVSNAVGVVTSQVARLTIGYPPPAIALLTPTNGTTFGAPANIALAATASSAAGVAKVQFFQGAAVLAEVDAAPYNFTWSGVPAGVYTFYAVATDIFGGSAQSASSTVIVTNVVPTNRVLRVVAATATPRAGFTVPVQMDALGNENTLEFSLAFNPALLTLGTVSPGSGLPSDAQLLVNTNDAGRGQIGVLVALENGQTMPAATLDLLSLGFTVNPAVASATNTTIAFADTPVTREIDSASVQVLSAAYVSGTVQISLGIEGDVWPRPYGDGQLTSSDWEQEGLFVAGLAQPFTTNEFERADTAPRATQGDGRLTVADWVQVGRYVASLDPLTPMGGNTPPAGPVPNGGTSSDQLVVGTYYARQGQQVVAVPVQLIGFGGENGVGFSVDFNETNVVFEGITNLVGQATNGTVVLNTNAAATGQIGVLFALPPGQSFSSGTNALLSLLFQVSATAPAAMPLTTADSPIVRQVASSAAAAVNAQFVDGAVNLVGSPTSPTIFAPTAQLQGSGFRASFTALPGLTYMVETSADLCHWGTEQIIQATAPMVSFTDCASNLPCRFYRIQAQ